MRTFLLILLFLFVHNSVYSIYPIVRNFSKTHYKSGTQNWDIVQNPGGCIIMECWNLTVRIGQPILLPIIPMYVLYFMITIPNACMPEHLMSSDIISWKIMVE